MRKQRRFTQVTMRHGNAFSESFDVTDGLLQQCCDCGLVHDWKFTVNGKRVRAAVRTNLQDEAWKTWRRLQRSNANNYEPRLREYLRARGAAINYVNERLEATR